MSAVSLHPKRPAEEEACTTNPLPKLLQTPVGLALLELQGTINLPGGEDTGGSGASQQGSAVPIGRLDFPDYREDALDPSSTVWMKRVYMYVGQHQRLTGEVKKLPKPLAVIRRKGADGVLASATATEEEDADRVEELEVVEIVKYKLMFSQRPEPVGTPAS